MTLFDDCNGNYEISLVDKTCSSMNCLDDCLKELKLLRSGNCKCVWLIDELTELEIPQFLKCIRTNSRNIALLYSTHSNYVIRECCNRILKGETVKVIYGK